MRIHDRIGGMVEKPRIVYRILHALGIGRPDPVKWNPWNKVVQDHRDGTVHRRATDRERARRGLRVPWTPDLREDMDTPVY